MTEKEQELLNVVRLGNEMRMAQKLYFRTRAKEALARSKCAEQAFDKAVIRALNPSLLGES